MERKKIETTRLKTVKTTRIIPTVQSATCYTPDEGDRTAFWHDSWTSLGRLCFAMRILYSFAEDQHCTIKSQRLRGTWHLKLLHDLLSVLADTPTPAGALGDCRLIINSGKPPSTKYFYNLFSDRESIGSPTIGCGRKSYRTGIKKFFG
jgi:hypothetical protein